MRHPLVYVSFLDDSPVRHPPRKSLNQLKFSTEARSLVFIVKFISVFLLSATFFDVIFKSSQSNKYIRKHELKILDSTMAFLNHKRGVKFSWVIITKNIY